MYPGDEMHTESLGRALRLLGDPEGPTYLRRAAEMVSERLPSGRRFRGSVHVGNLYRLAGDQRLSRGYLEPAYEALRLDSARQSVVDSGTRPTYLVDACLLLGRDAEAEALQGFFDFYERPEQPLYLLARSRRTGDPGPARRVMGLLERRIRDAERPFSARSLSVSDWDWYELAVEAARRPVQPSPEKIREDEAVVALVHEHLARESAIANLELFLAGLVPWRPQPAGGGSLRGTDLSGMDLGGLRLGSADLREADLSGSSLWGADLVGADLRGACLEHILAREALLRGANLSEAQLEVANLSGADLRGASLKRADLDYAVLRGADLEGADLDGANVRGADLSGVFFVGSSLKGANLKGAELRKANLREADLTGTDLRGADLERADLEGAILEDTIG